MTARCLSVSLVALCASSCFVVASKEQYTGPPPGCGACEETARFEPTVPLEWITLFDGTSLDAFRGYRAEDVPAGWRIVDGALVRVDGAGDLITRGEWGSFELAFEWRIPPGGNSGVMFHVSEDQGATWESGPEYQVLDNAILGEDGDPSTSAAANYALHAPSLDMTNPPGTWNRALLVVDHGHVEHWLNGVRVVSYDLWTPDWEARVAATKFKTRPAYGRNRKGHIAFQDHGARVAYRNIRLLPLD